MTSYRFAVRSVAECEHWKQRIEKENRAVKPPLPPSDRLDRGRAEAAFSDESVRSRRRSSSRRGAGSSSYYSGCSSSYRTGSSLDERLDRLEHCILEEKKGRKDVQEQLVNLQRMMERHFSSQDASPQRSN